MLDKIKNQSGLTIVELLVSLFLVSLLMAFVISANLFVNRFILDWEENVTLYEDGNFLTLALQKDLQYSYGFIKEDTIGYAIVVSPIDTIRYYLLDGNLLRNDKILNSSGILCQDLDFNKISFENRLPDSILIGGDNKYKAQAVIIKLELKHKDKSEVFSSSVRIKNVTQIY
jgi:hypothetical protein